MSGIPSLALTKTFTGHDIDGDDLDAALAEIVAHINTELQDKVLDLLLRSDETLADEVVRQRHLHPELGSYLRVLQAHVDEGATIMEECRVATIGNHGLTGLASIDGVTPIAGNRVLVRAQTDPTENGIYVAAAGSWARAADAASMATLGYCFVLVDLGDTLYNTCWFCDAGVDGTIGSVDVKWKKVSRASGGAPGPAGADGTIAPVADQTLVGNISGVSAIPIGLTPDQVATLMADWQAQAFKNFLADVVTEANTTWTLGASHRARYVKATNGSATTITLPNSLAVGFSVTIEQSGAGQLSFSAASGATIHNRQSQTKTAGQYAVVTLVVVANSDGAHAIYTLMGDTGA